MRTLLQRHPRLFDWAKSVGRRLGRQTPLYRFLDTVLPRDRPVTFVQAGAHDGLTNDPYREFILRPNFRGILIEPSPATFARLRRAYRDSPRFHFERCLVTYPPGAAVPFFSLDPGFVAGRPDAAQLTMLASTSRDQLVHSLAGHDDCLPHIVETLVPGHTVEQLLARHGLGAPDCLFLDVEGHEAPILLGLDLARCAPGLIAYETLHLGPRRAAVETRLTDAGYRLHDLGQEAVALRR